MAHLFCKVCAALALVVVSNSPLLRAEEASIWRVDTRADRLTIIHGDAPLAVYVFADPELTRPYFASVRTLDGHAATRNHPPRAGLDPTDHADMHPGIWLAFGDLNGADFWRNKGAIRQRKFVERPRVTEDGLTFTVENEYVAGGETVATEICRHTFLKCDGGYLLTYDSRFTGAAPLVFGDQEEMGLGVRIASPLRVKDGSGTIVSSDGKRNERDVRGTSAAWCDYRGTVDDALVGITIFPHPDNFRSAWWHARDYGLLVANPFGRQALTGGDVSRYEVPAGETLRLQFGVWIHSGPKNAKPNVQQAFEMYCDMD